MGVSPARPDSDPGGSAGMVRSLMPLARRIDTLNQAVGGAASWLALFMVIAQFCVVVLRYVFGFGAIFLQESIIYMHSLLFMLGAAYALLHNAHVRVDVFYRDARPETKARVDLFGALTFLIPVCVAIIYYSWNYVMNSWQVFEGSRETSGIHAVFLLKSVIIIFCVLLILQGLSMAIHALGVLCGLEPPPPDDGPKVP